MNAQELTKVVEDQRSQLQDLKKQVDFLQQMVDKLNLFVKDLQVDTKMIYDYFDKVRK